MSSYRWAPPRAQRRRAIFGVRRGAAVAGVLVLVAALVGIGLLAADRLTGRGPSVDRGLTVPWPSLGQAAIGTGSKGVIGTSGGHEPVPIASVAKVMTAYVVLRQHPLTGDRSGFFLSVTDADVADTVRRRALDQSLIAVRSGETLTERQALTAVLLPSANNVAAMLATATAGSEPAFVAMMNRTAESLGMHNTRYTDPSGFDPLTVSTAADQLILARAAMKVPAFAELVGQRSASLPVAGRVTNTDTLLGRDGFVGIKTGSDDDAGGCFMFQNVTGTGKHTVTIVGVVLGQPRLADALATSRRIVLSLRSQLQRTS